MSPPAHQRAERIARDVRIAPHVAPQPRGADGAARHPYHPAKHIVFSERAGAKLKTVNMKTASASILLGLAIAGSPARGRSGHHQRGSAIGGRSDSFPGLVFAG